MVALLRFDYWLPILEPHIRRGMRRRRVLRRAAPSVHKKMSPATMETGLQSRLQVEGRYSST
jgi:hypothetical protein